MFWLAAKQNGWRIASGRMLERLGWYCCLASDCEVRYGYVYHANRLSGLCFKRLITRFFAGMRLVCRRKGTGCVQSSVSWPQGESAARTPRTTPEKRHPDTAAGSNSGSCGRFAGFGKRGRGKTLARPPISGTAGRKLAKIRGRVSVLVSGRLPTTSRRRVTSTRLRRTRRTSRSTGRRVPLTGATSTSTSAAWWWSSALMGCSGPRPAADLRQRATR